MTVQKVLVLICLFALIALFTFVFFTPDVSQYHDLPLITPIQRTQTPIPTVVNRDLQNEFSHSPILYWRYDPDKNVDLAKEARSGAKGSNKGEGKNSDSKRDPSSPELRGTKPVSDELKATQPSSESGRP